MKLYAVFSRSYDYRDENNWLEIVYDRKPSLNEYATFFGKTLETMTPDEIIVLISSYKNGEFCAFKWSDTIYKLVGFETGKVIHESI